MCLSAVTLGGPAQAEKTPEEVTAAIESTYDVQVLKIEKVKTPDGTVYAVTVMVSGGNGNDAFLVNTLAVDPETGDLVRQPVQDTSGAARPGHTTDEGFGRRLRQDSARAR